MSNVLVLQDNTREKRIFLDENNIVKVGDRVIISIDKSLYSGQVLGFVDDTSDSVLNKIVRKVDESDERIIEKNNSDSKKALLEAKKLQNKMGLSMNFVDSYYTFDRKQLFFLFVADNRIDFREIAKKLADKYKTRIELRQIGVRDEVKRIGGNGVCGRELCCCSFLRDFEAVSIKMAKEQNLSLNPSKISGNCGRLMCCLKYENEVYEEKLKKLPNIGAIVKTEDGEGEVDNIETLKEVVRVKLKDGDNYTYKRYNVSDIKIIKDNKSVVLEDTEEKEHKKELEELERLEEQDNKNRI